MSPAHIPQDLQCPACSMRIVPGELHACTALAPTIGPKTTRVLEAIERQDRRFDTLEAILQKLEAKIEMLLALQDDK